MTEAELLKKLSDEPERVSFAECIAVIDENYEFQEGAFQNGNQQNQAGQNSGSCKILAFAQRHKLSTLQTLSCFGDFYRHDVLEHPNGVNHQNIRQFMQGGWKGVHFDSEPLRCRAEKRNGT